MRLRQGAGLLEVRGGVMSDELNPCPFCGGKPYEAHHLTYSWWAVTCKCGAEGPSFRADTPEEHKCSAYQKATAAWNGRASTAPTWWKCATHGPAKAGSWGCPDCTRELREELAGLEALVADTEWLKAELSTRADK